MGKRGAPPDVLLKTKHWIVIQYELTGVMPSISDTEAIVGVARGTVQKARSQLKAEGKIPHIVPHTPARHRPPDTADDVTPLSADKLRDLPSEPPPDESGPPAHVEPDDGSVADLEEIQRIYSRVLRRAPDQIKTQVGEKLARIQALAGTSRDLGPGPPQSAKTAGLRLRLMLEACGFEFSGAVFRWAFKDQMEPAIVTGHIPVEFFQEYPYATPEPTEEPPDPEPEGREADQPDERPDEGTPDRPSEVLRPDQPEREEAATDPEGEIGLSIIDEEEVDDGLETDFYG